MTKDPACISSESDVQEAVEFFLKQHVGSVPVVGDDQKVIGHLSELGLMKAFVKRKVAGTHRLRVIDFKDVFVTPKFVVPSTPLVEVVKGIAQCPLHRVLVQKESGRLVGIISPKDVLRALSGDLSQTGRMQVKLLELEKEVNKLSEQLNETQRSFDNYAMLFDSAGYMMHSADKDGKILFANQRLHERLGYNEGSLIGRSVYDLYAPHVHDEIKIGLEKVAQFGRHELVYSTYLRKNGQPLRVEVVSSSLKDGSGHFIGTFTISRPIDSEAMLRSLHGVFDD